MSLELSVLKNNIKGWLWGNKLCGFEINGSDSTSSQIAGFDISSYIRHEMLLCF